MAAWGFDWSEEQARDMVGNALRDTAAALMRLAGREGLDPDEYADVLNTYALEDMLITGVPWRPGADDLLFAAREAGVRCALVSATFERVLGSFVDTLPAGTFDVIVGGDAVAFGKPHPEPYLTALERLGLAVADAVAFEDSIPGTTSAERAGLVTLGIPFKQVIVPGPRRVIVPTLEGLTLADVGRTWRDLRDA